MDCSFQFFERFHDFIATLLVCNVVFLFMGELITRLARLELENEGGKFGNPISAIFGF